MPDYKEMYRILFHETTKAISALQQAQQLTEEMYFSDDAANNFIMIKSEKELEKNNKQSSQG